MNTSSVHLLGVSETVIGLTIVAIGTTLPDKTISLVGGLKARGGIVVANAAGSNIFPLTLVLGVSAMATPLAADGRTVVFNVPVMLGSAFLLCVLVVPWRLYWRTGAVLLALSISDLAFQFVVR
jgi:cation:H+ antiporter